MGRLTLPLIVCVLLGRACCEPPTTAAPETTASSTAAPHASAAATATASSGPESTFAPAHPEPTTAAETSDASAVLQRDATLDQVIAALDGLCQSAGRATAAGSFATLTNALAGVQTMLAAVSSRLDGVHASQLELHNSLEERLDAFQTEVSSRLAEVQTEVSSRLSESQTEVSSRLAEVQTEVSSRLDAVQTALSEDRDGLRRWQTETDNTLTSMRQRLTNLTGELGDWRTSVGRAQTAHQSAVQTQLEDILTAVSRIPKPVLGEACGRDTDCSPWLPQSACSASGVCTCRDGYRQVDRQCRQQSRLDEVCLEDVDCHTSNSVCINGKCTCASDFWNYNNGECRMADSLNMDRRCVSDRHCHKRLNQRCLRLVSPEYTKGRCSCQTRTDDGYEYRLVGGPSCSEGTVQLRRTGGLWGLVCDDEWSTFDANVLCRSLGFSYGQATVHSQYGRGTNFFMDDVECTGSEEHLALCSYSGWGQHNCGAGEVAGVSCYNSWFG